MDKDHIKYRLDQFKISNTKVLFTIVKKNKHIFKVESYGRVVTYEYKYVTCKISGRSFYTLLLR